MHTTTDRLRRLVSPRYRHKPSGYQRTIVAGIHDSSRSMRAANRAGALAADFDAELILVGAYEEPDRVVFKRASDALKGESHIAQPSFDIDNALHDGETRARAAGARNLRTLVIKGDATRGLLDVAYEQSADILVLGNHQQAIDAELIGTINEQVSRSTPTHVLLVH